MMAKKVALVFSSKHIILLIFSVIEFFDYGLGAITVSHRVTKKTVLTAQQNFIPFDFPLKTSLTNKTHLIISEPPNACSTVDPPPVTDTSQIHSVQGSVHQPNWVLLVDDSDCDIHLKLVHAQLQRYSGVIIYASGSNSPRPMHVAPHLTHLYKISVSFIGLGDALELKKYAYPKQYLIKIEQDWTLSYAFEYFQDICLESLTDAKKYIGDRSEKISQWMRKSFFDAAEIVFQVMAVTSPLWFLLFWYWDEWKTLREARHNYRENQQDFGEEFFANFDFTRERSQQSNYQESTEPPKKPVNSYEDYRKLLGVNRGDSKAQIDSAFRKLSKIYHPDKNGQLPTAEVEQRAETFKKLNKAREELVKLC